MVRWAEIVNIVKDECFPYFQGQGVKPTLRTVFYWLVSKGLIPNTKSAYKGLSKALVRARQEGVFPWDFLEDKVRYCIQNFNDRALREDKVKEVEERARAKLNAINLEELINEWFDWLIPSSWTGFWAGQPVVPEIWIEKEALVETIKNWTRSYEVNIRVNRGYSSWTFIYENVKALKSVLERHDKVVILYLGDLDPSGVDIERFLKEALDYFDITERVKLVRLAVTEDQVERYNLPPRPEDAETVAKLQRDPRYKGYSKKYIVELDALVAYVPEEFKRLITDAVLKHHDRRIYEEERRKTMEIIEECKRVVKEYKEKALEKIVEEAGRIGK